VSHFKGSFSVNGVRVDDVVASVAVKGIEETLDTVHIPEMTQDSRPSGEFCRF
jgi:hypothetical protein